MIYAGNHDKIWWKPPTWRKHRNQFKKMYFRRSKNLKLGKSIVHTNMDSHEKDRIHTHIWKIHTKMTYFRFICTKRQNLYILSFGAHEPYILSFLYDFSSLSLHLNFFVWPVFVCTMDVPSFKKNSNGRNKFFELVSMFPPSSWFPLHISPYNMDAEITWTDR